MKQLYNNPYSAHQDISLLLPWYVNKTLHGAELERVENHLKVCLTCRREFATLHKLAAAVQQEGLIDSAAQASFSQLKKRIQSADELSMEQAPKALDQHEWYRKFRLEHFTLPRPALALAAVVLLSLLLPRVIDTGNNQLNEYRTLSNAEKPAVSPNTISVIFSIGTQLSQINDIVASVHGKIVEGPTEEGIYKIAVESELTSESVLERVTLLRKNTNVIFVEPAYALLSSTQANKGTK